MNTNQSEFISLIIRKLLQATQDMLYLNQSTVRADKISKSLPQANDSLDVCTRKFHKIDNEFNTREKRVLSRANDCFEWNSDCAFVRMCWIEMINLCVMQFLMNSARKRQ